MMYSQRANACLGALSIGWRVVRWGTGRGFEDSDPDPAEWVELEWVSGLRVCCGDLLLWLNLGHVCYAQLTYPKVWAQNDLAVDAPLNPKKQTNIPQSFESGTET